MDNQDVVRELQILNARMALVRSDTFWIFICVGVPAVLSLLAVLVLVARLALVGLG